MLLAAKVISFEAFFHNLPLNSYFVVALLLFSGGSNYDGEVIMKCTSHRHRTRKTANVYVWVEWWCRDWRLLRCCSHIKSLPAIKTSATNKLFPS